MEAVRPPAVAGTFYPADPGELAGTVRGFLTESESPKDIPPPKAVIVPHAGYIYSGACAAKAYARVAPAAGRIKRVVMVGAAHRMAIDGMAVPTVDAFDTPLGRVPLDRTAIERALILPYVHADDTPHRDDHNLEVQLPFLQELFGDFVLFPVLTGRTDGEQVAELLKAFWGGPETLIVISSDLSHYHDYDTAQRLDGDTRRAIESLRPDAIGREQACGRVPVSGLLLETRRRGLGIETLDMRNSGDTAGPRDRVVGYGAWAVTESDVRLLQRHGGKLLDVAIRTIVHGLQNGAPPDKAPEPWAPELAAHRATFLTLERNGNLRGCIGSLFAQRPMIRDVVENAYKAAFKDPRFKPLTSDDTKGLSITLSILSPAVRMPVQGAADLTAALRPKIDGLIIKHGDKRGIFLPAVWEKIPKPEDFVAALKDKATIDRAVDPPDLEAYRFVTSAITRSPGPKAA